MQKKDQIKEIGGSYMVYEGISERNYLYNGYILVFMLIKCMVKKLRVKEQQEK